MIYIPKIGDVVVKKSGKKFQNGEKSATVTAIGEMTIPTGMLPGGRKEIKTVAAVELAGCEGMVTANALRIAGDSDVK